MKIKDIKDLHSKTVEELIGMFKRAKDEILDFNLDKSQAKLKNTRSIFLKKKDMARILTILKIKELAK